MSLVSACYSVHILTDYQSNNSAALTFFSVVLVADLSADMEKVAIIADIIP